MTIEIAFFAHGQKTALALHASLFRIAAPLPFFAMLLGNLSDRLLPVYQKHCRYVGSALCWRLLAF